MFRCEFLSFYICHFAWTMRRPLAFSRFVAPFLAFNLWVGFTSCPRRQFLHQLSAKIAGQTMDVRTAAAKISNPARNTVIQNRTLSVVIIITQCCTPNNPASSLHRLRGAPHKLHFFYGDSATVLQIDPSPLCMQRHTAHKWAICPKESPALSYQTHIICPASPGTGTESHCDKSTHKSVANITKTRSSDWVQQQLCQACPHVSAEQPALKRRQ